MTETGKGEAKKGVGEEEGRSCGPLGPSSPGDL